MNNVKTLYKLARAELFYKDYYCLYCGIMDHDKDYMREHVKTYHDEIEKERRMFRCRKCYRAMKEYKILAHECHLDLE